MTTDDQLPVVLRVWTDNPRETRRAGRNDPIEHVVLVDTETTIDQAQSFTYGAYRYCRLDPSGLLRCLAEGLIYADDLPERDPDGYQTLVDYATSQPADVDRADLSAQRALRLLSRTEFVEQVVWRLGYKGRATIVMFNAGFDWSRLAIDAGTARGSRPRTKDPNAPPRKGRRLATWGGFSLKLWDDDKHRPRLQIKSLDSKRALKSFTAPDVIDAEDLLDLDPDDLHADDTGRTPVFRGHLLDLRTLGFALTNTGHSLKTAGELLAIAHPKSDAPPHGQITPEHIDYCLRDVLATGEVFEGWWAEYRRHPIDLQPTKAFSPASIAKAYLRAMGVRSILDRQPDFDPQVLGYCMSAFYGGRAEVHHRKQSVPVRLVDYVSMYPSVVANMNLWSLVVADRIDTVDATGHVQDLLDQIAAAGEVPPQLWPDLVGVARCHPDGSEILPIRAHYGEGPSHTIGINHLQAAEPLWYPIADLAASAVLTGTAPRIDCGLQFRAVGVQPGLSTVVLRGATPVDPARQDPFKTATEERQRIKKARTGEHPDGKCICGDCSQMDFLKTFANAGSYGIFAEINRNPLPVRESTAVTVYANRDQPWTAKVGAVETPGEFCFPPIAAAITAGARLMLALLEHQVTSAGGSWVFCDTDSMAIIATDNGGPVKPRTGDDHGQTVNALSTLQVNQIMASFTALNPYDRDAVPGSILRPVTQGQCHAISAKRYTLWNEDDAGKVEIGKHTEHGLGHLLNPYTPEQLDADDAPDWIGEVWESVVADELGLTHGDPDWYEQPVLSRYTISSPGLWSAFKPWNKDKPWAEQVKPFNFLLVAHVAKYNHPDGVDQLTLIAPYSSEPDEWPTLPWRNRHNPDGPTYTITTDWTHDDQHAIGVQTYADILGNYRRHPEAKFADATGHTCAADTVGQLHRRTVAQTSTRYIGKEADLLDEVGTGLTPTGDEPVTDYTPTSDDFAATREVLHEVSTEQLMGEIRRLYPQNPVSDAAWARTIQRARRGGTPHQQARQILEAATQPWLAQPHTDHS